MTPKAPREPRDRRRPTGRGGRLALGSVEGRQVFLEWQERAAQVVALETYPEGVARLPVAPASPPTQLRDAVLVGRIVLDDRPLVLRLRRTETTVSNGGKAEDRQVRRLRWFRCEELLDLAERQAGTPEGSRRLLWREEEDVPGHGSDSISVELTVEDLERPEGRLEIAWHHDRTT